MTTRRGTTNRNDRGSAETRRRRRAWLVATYRADVDVFEFVIDGSPMQRRSLTVPLGSGEAACRCYRCGVLLTVVTVTVDRIKPGIEGGTYRRNNIRPACGGCNSETGSLLGHARRRARKAA